MDVDFWIELESTYKQRIAERYRLYVEYGHCILSSLPGSELACKELMEMVIQFLCARYPAQFTRNDHTLVNRILGTTTDLLKTEPLMVLLKNVPEDFALMMREPQTGHYVLRAGVVCSTLGWNLSEKMGQGLLTIHHHVPDYREKMGFSVDRFFTKLPAEKPIQRGSWSLEVGQPLFLPSGHPQLAYRETYREPQNLSLKPEDIHLRVDWQTLRRLPLSGAVVFNFKALFTPITHFKDEPYIPSIVLKVLNEGKESLLRYKATWHVEHVAKPVLKQFEEDQVAKGLVEKNWEPGTLPEAPFFKGWEKKWAC